MEAQAFDPTRRCGGGLNIVHYGYDQCSQDLLSQAIDAVSRQICRKIPSEHRDRVRFDLVENPYMQTTSIFWRYAPSEKQAS